MNAAPLLVNRLCSRCGLFFRELAQPDPTVLRIRAWATCPRCQETVVAVEDRDVVFGGDDEPQ